MFDDIYRNKRVLITGHTGFKGSWLAMWLSHMGAKVSGYALPPQTKPSHFQLLNLGQDSIMGDVRDAEQMKLIFKQHQPEIIFHLAAQAIVRHSYKDPVETFSSNIMGTVNVLESARESASVRAIINVTSDKCYENREQARGYREEDPMGGYDPYSASKGCAEIITSSYRQSFFNLEEYGRAHNILLASARAGNVIGGGDWSVDRLVPDIVRAVRRDEKVMIRNPHAIRPWQHVLEPLSGYLLLGQRLLEGRKEFSEGWNFGPSEEENITVGWIVDQMKRVWPKIDCDIDQKPDQPHEANMLRLDCSKARTRLRWTPVWNAKTAAEQTGLWYRKFFETDEAQSMENLNSYIADAKKRNIIWTEE
jgi:CDP-glucose 4,6-dehydratase